MDNPTRRALAWPCLALVAAFLACGAMVRGYLVGPSVSLAQLMQDADVVFKGTAASATTVKDDWFKPVGGFVVRETKFKVISVIQGKESASNLAFRYYDPDPDPNGRSMYSPQSYHFDAGKTYIVFAKRDGTSGAYRQLWESHTMKGDQGVVRCGNNKPAASNVVKDVLWSELTTMLAAKDAADAAYAIRQLDEMSDDQSDSPFAGLSDLGRQEVTAAVLPLTAHRDAKVALAAIAVIGSHNPYLSDERTIHWLATVGSAEVPGMGKMNPKMQNVGGELYWKDLAALADAKGTTETRVAAIRALGLVREPALRDAIQRWLADPVPAVRAAAAVLQADFPGPESIARISAAAGDTAPEVRAAAALAAGFSQQTELAGVLGKLATDADKKVRRAATMSLLSFSPKNEAIAAVFRANLKNEEFQPLFLVALARDNPSDYLDDLATAVTRKVEPRDFWGGQLPAFTAWEILFKFLQNQPAEKVRAGEFDHYLDAIEKVGHSSSSEPRDIYAFYLQRGMTERAKQFREAAKKTVTYDLDYYFDMVDKNPSQYKRFQ